MDEYEKLEKEFIFIRDKLKQIAGHMSRNENIEAAFLIGCLNSVCHNDAVEMKRLNGLENESMEKID